MRAFLLLSREGEGEVAESAESVGAEGESSEAARAQKVWKEGVCVCVCGGSDCSDGASHTLALWLIIGNAPSLLYMTYIGSTRYTAEEARGEEVCTGSREEIQERQVEKTHRKSRTSSESKFVNIYAQCSGRGEKPGFLQGRGRGADKEEEEFAVSASVEGQRGKGGERRKGQQVGSKSKKQQFKVRV